MNMIEWSNALHIEGLVWRKVSNPPLGTIYLNYPDRHREDTRPRCAYVDKIRWEHATAMVVEPCRKREPFAGFGFHDEGNSRVGGADPMRSSTTARRMAASVGRALSWITFTAPPCSCWMVPVTLRQSLP